MSMILWIVMMIWWIVRVSVMMSDDGVVDCVNAMVCYIHVAVIPKGVIYGWVWRSMIYLVVYVLPYCVIVLMLRSRGEVRCCYLLLLIYVIVWGYAVFVMMFCVIRPMLWSCNVVYWSCLVWRMWYCYIFGWCNVGMCAAVIGLANAMASYCCISWVMWS